MGNSATASRTAANSSAPRAAAARPTGDARDKKRRTPRGFDSLAQQAYLNLWRSYDRLRALEDELFGRYDLSAQQYNALRLLRAEYPGSLPTLALAGRLISRAPDITRLVDKLDERGLVARNRPAGDRRTVQVAITRAGMALLDRLSDEVRACHERQLGHLSAAKLRTLVGLLRDARAPHEDAAAPPL